MLNKPGVLLRFEGALLLIASVVAYPQLGGSWTSAHIALDRMLGYGLKYPTYFRDTHLQRV